MRPKQWIRRMNRRPNGDPGPDVFELLAQGQLLVPLSCRHCDGSGVRPLTDAEVTTALRSSDAAHPPRVTFCECPIGLEGQRNPLKTVGAIFYGQLSKNQG